MQLKHSVAFVAFCAVPAAQLEHSLRPVVLPYFPAEQPVQSFAAAPLYVPSGHDSQLEAP